MPEPLLSFVVGTALKGLAVDFFKKIAIGVIGLFKEDEVNSIFNKAFDEFKEKCFQDNSAKDEKKLLHVFQEFFTDDRTIGEFKPALEGQTRVREILPLEILHAGGGAEKP